MSNHSRAADVSSDSGKLQLWLTVALSAAILMTLLFSAGASRADKHKVERRYAHADVSTIQMHSSYQREQRVFGLLESASASSLGFEQTGRIISIAVDEGDTVATGQVLAQLDISKLTSQQAELYASLQRATADVSLAESTLQRVRSVLNQGGSSQQQVDEALARFNVVSAQVKEIEAAISSLQIEIDKSTLTAPFAGVVGARLVDEGTVVQPGTPILELGAPSQLQARLAMPQALATTLVKAQTLNIDTGNYRIDGHLLSIQSTRNRQTRTVDALVAVPNGSDDLLIGDMVSASLQTKVNQAGAWVPLSALTQGVRGLWSLLVVVGDEPSHLQSRLVEIVYATNKMAFIRGAINEGDKFVVQGGQRLVPGQLVKTKLVESMNAGSSQ
ncbi:efflux RND transporter periplasmic adaptor subunit [Alteromonas ponticola]|uniref:Efflux RND transporter periplasmic adaptor subunit n=1 Tax=Alteromonas aquimaris TaxID=2998417 RepID=A0ABT3PAH1_9ALTE|nr:efflux RND transporter periplasmic adaptor subunit [Alteromonas aquimaris]MCW8109765.1 efflux RND transporter periplasmic adaptor subunit [Alteromonas aquimaris]